MIIKSGYCDRKKTSLTRWNYLFVAGAPQEGAESFFRGPGKGLMGLMTKPSGGVVDCIAMARDGLKRCVLLKSYG